MSPPQAFPQLPPDLDILSESEDVKVYTPISVGIEMVASHTSLSCEATESPYNDQNSGTKSNIR